MELLKIFQRLFHYMIFIYCWCVSKHGIFIYMGLSFSPTLKVKPQIHLND
jgi:hypothetical protein